MSYLIYRALYLPQGVVQLQMHDIHRSFNHHNVLPGARIVCRLVYSKTVMHFKGRAWMIKRTVLPLNGRWLNLAPLGIEVMLCVMLVESRSVFSRSQKVHLFTVAILYKIHDNIVVTFWERAFICNYIC